MSDFGHQPVVGPPDYRGRKTVCARCQTRTVMVYGGQFDDGPSRVTETDPVTWPCTSAVVLGLVPREVTA